MDQTVVTFLARLATALLAFAGHVAVAVWLLNFAYGHAVPRIWLRRFRKAHLLWLFTTTFPVLAWAALVLPWPEPVLTPRLPAPLTAALHAYVLACVVIGTWVVLPITLIRALRGVPQWQQSNHTEVVDIEETLGYRPIGDGPKVRFARLRWNHQFEVEVIEKEFRLPRVPGALDGLTILHMSDFHFTGCLSREFYEAVLRQTERWDPDLVCLTGDFVDNPRYYEWIHELFSALRGRYGRFALLGNHDSWFDVGRIRQELGKAGFEIPGPQGRTIQVCGAGLFVASTEWPWLGPLPVAVQRDECDFALLLAHTPDCIYEVSKRGYDLVLCGHNHGGQVRLPLIGPVYMPSRYSRRFDMGPFQVGETALYVNKGIAGEHPLRWNARPEVTLIRLRSGNAAS